MRGCAGHLPDPLSRAFALYAYGHACAPDRLKIGLTEGDTVDRIAAQIGRPWPTTRNANRHSNVSVGTTQRSIAAMASAWFRRKVRQLCDGDPRPLAPHWKAPPYHGAHLKRTSSCGSTERAETKRELKAQRKSPAEAGQMSRACAAARHDNCQATSTTLLITTVVATVVAASSHGSHSHGDRLAGTVGARIYGSSKPYVAQAREQLRLLDFRSLALPRHRRFRKVQCQPRRLLLA